MIIKPILVFSIIVMFNFSSLYPQTGWISQQSGTNHTIQTMYFLNANTGYLGTATPGWMSITGKIIKTTNGGQNWITVYTSGTTGPGFYKIFFFNEMTGFAVGSAQTSGVFLKTIDGGVSWAILNYTFNCSDFQFINSLTGFACGGSYIKTTIDGGNNWSYQVIPGVMLSSISFPNSQTGYAAGTESYYDHPAICITTNGGIGWSDTVLTNYNNRIFSVHIVNANTGYFVGGQTPSYDLYDCIILKTTDRGNSFIRQLSGTGSNLFSTCFVNENTGFAVGGNSPYQANIIIKTSDGGNNWLTQLNSINGSTLHSVFFLDSFTGYAAGTSGTIYKTTNGGVTNIQQVSNKVPYQFSLYQNYPNPFNPVTRISFDLPKTSAVRLFVYDVNGKLVGNILNENLRAGTYSYDFDGSSLSSGVYFYRIIAEDYNQVKRMVLVK